MSALSVLSIGSAISYLVAFAFPALDAVFPVVPSEAAVIALGVTTAGSTDPRIAVLVALAALGAFAGDNLSYAIGRRFRPQVERRFFSSEKGVRRRAGAERALQRYGVRLIIFGRFVPGGRTAVTLVCGIVGYRRRSFAGATLLAGAIWASYAFFLGRLGGRVFEHSPWLSLVIALGAAVVLSGLIEAVRRLWGGAPSP